MEAQEEERKRISRELHDETGQGLMVLRLYLGMLGNESNGSLEKSKIDEAMVMLDRTIGDLRRIIARLSPRTLEELGLLAAIRKEARELSKHTGLRTTLELPDELPLDHEVEVAIYRCVQECFHNIAKHAQAHTYKLSLEQLEGAVLLRVCDDGVGFSQLGGISRRSFGLTGMRERLAALGGTVRVRSRTGRGTQVLVRLPLSLKRRRKKKVQSRQGKNTEPKASANARALTSESGLREIIEKNQYSHGD
ncbi:MAG: sensor histidine kinase [Acidobacteriales bacterium]|nr:sensor histidine kinase [Terriglobales bacterium]